jgi:UDPglucose--hexose-1-phosphate uridylyltransferase
LIVSVVILHIGGLMPQLRRDPTSGKWVVIATERAKRPDQFNKENVSVSGECAFCYGNEGMTPPETLAYRGEAEADTPGWQVRVVPNKFPVFAPEGAGGEDGQGLFVSAPSYGGHEVIIHSPDHNRSFAQLEVEQVALVIEAYRDRYLYWKADPRIEFIEIILNHGKNAGASLEHPHSQLFAMPLVPPAAADQLRGSAGYFAETGRCVYCDTIKDERSAGVRAIAERDGLFLFAPYASRLPFETWILPTEHQPFFERICDAEMRSLGSMLIDILERYDRVLGDPAFNLFLHTTPCKSESTDYHWHIEILPKLTAIAGFELGTGMMINIATPEDAAAYLRGDRRS